MLKTLNEINALFDQARCKIEELRRDDLLSDLIDDYSPMFATVHDAFKRAIADNIKPFPEISAGFEEFRFRVKGEIIFDTFSQAQAESKWAELVISGTPFEMVVLYDERFKFIPELESSININ